MLLSSRVTSKKSIFCCTRILACADRSLADRGSRERLVTDDAGFMSGHWRECFMAVCVMYCVSCLQLNFQRVSAEETTWIQYFMFHVFDILDC